MFSILSLEGFFKGDWMINWRQILGYKITQEDPIGWLVSYNNNERYAVIVAVDNTIRSKRCWGFFGADALSAMHNYLELKDYPNARKSINQVGGELTWVRLETVVKIRYVESVPFEVNLNV